MKRKKQLVKIRKFPFPYRAALTICSDIDECDLKTFLELHLFLNTTEETIYGRGLGLDIGDSFWLYSENPNDMSYFEGVTNKRSKCGEVIEDFIRAGYIDCLHSYGNLASKWKNKKLWRENIARVLKQFKKSDLVIDTWINHGLGSCAGNLMARKHSNFTGDNPQSEFYHADLMTDYGIRYVWLNDLTDTLLHEVKFTSNLLHISANMLIDMCRNVFSITKGQFRGLCSPFHVNSLIEPTVLLDGKKILSFKRFHIGSSGLWDGAFRENLVRQLADHVLKKLIKGEGVIIVYTHLGRTAMPKSEYLFDQETLGSLRRLADKYQSKQVFVTTTSRLLNFITRRIGLEWEEKFSKDGAVDVHIKGIKDPVDGLRKVKPGDLEGICFQSPYKTNIRIWIDNAEVKPDFVYVKEGQHVIAGFDFPRLKYPEKYKDKGFIDNLVKKTK